MKKNPLGFLNNKRNVKKVWVAEQEAAAAAKASEDRARTLRLERSQMEERALLGRTVDEQQLEFMYKPPPSLVQTQAQAQDKPDPHASHPPSNSTDSTKVAPTAGKYARELQGAEISLKPLGKENRRVRCLRCGVVGHQTGDRECGLRDTNPNDSWRKATEDPMFAHLHKGHSKITPAHAEMLDQVRQHTAATLPPADARLGAEALQFRQHIHRSYVDPSASGPHQLLPEVMDDTEEPEERREEPTGDTSAEMEFLASLSHRQKKRLLRHLEAQARKGAGGEYLESSSSSSSSSLSSSSGGTRRHKRRHKSRRKERRRSQEKSQKHSNGHRRSEERKGKKRKRSSPSARAPSPKRTKVSQAPELPPTQ